MRLQYTIYTLYNKGIRMRTYTHTQAQTHRYKLTQRLEHLWLDLGRIV